MNTPNKITLTRLLLIPFIVFFYYATFIPYAKFVAVALFIIACLTDFVDGHIARKYNQVTDLGKFFDSIADKILIMTAMVLIVGTPKAQSVAWPLEIVSACVIAMLAREFIISALRQIAAAKGKVLAAEWSGKIKATMQYITFTLYFIYSAIFNETMAFYKDGSPRANIVVNIIMLVLLATTTLLTVYSGVGYLIKNRHVFKEGKEGELKEDDE